MKVIDTVDMETNSHTADYLLKIVVKSNKTCKKYECTIRSIVTDNASNISKREQNWPNLIKLELPTF